MRIQAVLSVAVCAAACGRAALVRDQVTLQRGSVSEEWRLEWRSEPSEACMPETAMDVTCPCIGFAYGQRGALDLVRHRAHEDDERLALTPLFKDGETPIYSEIPHDSTEAVVQRWPVFSTDIDADDRGKLAQEVRRRKPTSVLALGDYDHDGEATEFVLQIGYLPCGKREAVLIGISAARPALHAFTSIGHPERALILEATIWSGLLTSDSVTAVEWSCGDHGGNTQTEVRIVATPRGFDGVRSEYACGLEGKTAKLISSERI